MNGQGDNYPLVPSKQLLQIRTEIYRDLRQFTAESSLKTFLSFGFFTVLPLPTNVFFLFFFFFRLFSSMPQGGENLGVSREKQQRQGQNKMGFEIFSIQFCHLCTNYAEERLRTHRHKTFFYPI